MVESTRIFPLHLGQRSTLNPNVLFIITAIDDHAVRGGRDDRRPVAGDARRTARRDLDGAGAARREDGCEEQGCGDLGRSCARATIPLSVQPVLNRLARFSSASPNCRALSAILDGLRRFRSAGRDPERAPPIPERFRRFVERARPVPNKLGRFRSDGRSAERARAFPERVAVGRTGPEVSGALRRCPCGLLRPRTGSGGPEARCPRSNGLGRLRSASGGAPEAVRAIPKRSGRFRGASPASGPPGARRCRLGAAFAGSRARVPGRARGCRAARGLGAAAATLPVRWRAKPFDARHRRSLAAALVHGGLRRRGWSSSASAKDGRAPRRRWTSRRGFEGSASTGTAPRRSTPLGTGRAASREETPPRSGRGRLPLGRAALDPARALFHHLAP